MPTLTELQERLSLYKAAERRLLVGHQSYTIGGQSYTLADLGKIQSAIRAIEQQISTHPDSTGRGRLSHSQAVFGGRR